MLILVTMFLMFCFGFLGLIPFFQKHEYAVLFLGELVITIPVAMGIGLLKNESEIGSSLFKRFPPSLIPILIILPFCMQCFVTYLTLPVQTLLYELLGERAESIEAASSQGEFFAQVFCVCLVPAILEEFLCRGVIMRMLKPYGIAVSMTVSALAFTILHFDIYSFLIIFMLGMLLSAVKILTGSIWACVLMHFSNNLAAIISAFIISEQMTTALTTVNIASLILFPVCLILMIKKMTDNVTGFRDVQKKKAGFSIEMVICLAVFAGTAVLDIWF